MKIYEELREYADTCMENEYDLTQCYQALSTCIDEFADGVISPDPYKAILWAKGQDKSEEAEFSCRFIYEYKKLCWLVQVARDYCFNALEKLEKVNNVGSEV